jgi:hypothetical protein
LSKKGAARVKTGRNAPEKRVKNPFFRGVKIIPKAKINFEICAVL